MKKIFTFVMLAIAALAANAAVTFHVTPGGEYTPTLYVWNDEGNDAAWPGTQMTVNEDGTYIGTTSKTGTVNFIINNGNGGNGNQTVNLSANVVDGDVVNVVVTPNDGMWTATVVVAGQEPATIEKFYVIGNLQDAIWNPAAGVELAKVDNTFEGTITLVDDPSYFSFTTTLAQNDGNNGGWDEINGKGYRYGANTADEEITLTDEVTSCTAALVKKDNDGSFKIAAGTYKVTVFMSGNEPAEMTIAKTETTGVNDVNSAKAVAGVRYFNLQGAESAEAFNGVNIMVTNYTDGTTTATKVIR